MKSRRRDGGSYEFVKLVRSNVKLVSEQTGMSQAVLNEALDRAAKEGTYVVHIPLQTKIFKRDD